MTRQFPGGSCHADTAYRRCRPRKTARAGRASGVYGAGFEAALSAWEADALPLGDPELTQQSSGRLPRTTRNERDRGRVGVRRKSARRESNPHVRCLKPSSCHWMTNAELAPQSSISVGTAGVEPATLSVDRDVRPVAAATPGPRESRHHAITKEKKP